MRRREICKGGFSSATKAICDAPAQIVIKVLLTTHVLILPQSPVILQSNSENERNLLPRGIIPFSLLFSPNPIYLSS